MEMRIETINPPEVGSKQSEDFAGVCFHQLFCSDNALQIRNISL